jgi:hypothetical protein
VFSALLWVLIVQERFVGIMYESLSYGILFEDQTSTPHNSALTVRNHETERLWFRRATNALSHVRNTRLHADRWYLSLLKAPVILYRNTAKKIHPALFILRPTEAGQQRPGKHCRVTIEMPPVGNITSAPSKRLQ